MFTGAEGQQQRFEPGTILEGRYEILEVLGEGGFGCVYKARHQYIDRMVAIKVLNTHQLTQSGGELENFESRFIREARSTARIKHPNVVAIYDFGFTGTARVPFLVMEFLDGHDLSEELEFYGPMPLKRFLRLFIPCLEALSRGHDLGIVHRDLKPANLFLRHPGQEDESLIVLDFGIASLEASQTSGFGKTDPGRLTGMGQALGTPKYSAPELVISGVTTPALDVYQMGLILVEALSGQPAVDATHPFKCLDQHVNGELNIPAVLKSGPLGAILERALALNHLDRYPTAHEFRAALLSFLSTARFSSGEWAVRPRTGASLPPLSEELPSPTGSGPDPNDETQLAGISGIQPPSFTGIDTSSNHTRPEQRTGDHIKPNPLVQPRARSRHEALLKEDDLLAAYIWTLHLAQGDNPDPAAPGIADGLRNRLLEEAIERIQPFLEKRGHMLLSFGELTDCPELDHRAGFLFGLMDAQTPIHTVLDFGASAMPRAEVALTLLVLEHRGIIGLY